MTNLNSKIEWTDITWSPTVGCTKVSPGCDHCYAETITERFHGKGSFAEVKLHHDRLNAPRRWRKPRRVFVNSMSDLFHKDIPDEFIARVWAVMAATPQHTYQILTKRHGRMRSLIGSTKYRQDSAHVLGNVTEDGDANHDWLLFGRNSWPLPNVHLGVSVEDQKHADLRIPALLDTPAAVRFLSCEPLLGPIDLGIDDPHRGHENDDVNGYSHPRICLTCSTEDENDVEYFRRDPSQHPDFHWVICGGESGPGARPCDPEWIRSLIKQCQAASVPVFVKQMGSIWARDNGYGGKGGSPEQWPEDLRIRQFLTVVTS